MQAQKLLSICIPTYNRAHYLDVCLQSIAKQSNTDLINKFDILIGDNASTDNTKEIIDKYITTFNLPVIYNKNKENIGAVNNFLQIFERATSEFVYLIGDDDIMTDNSLSVLCKVLQENRDNTVFHFKCVQTEFISKNATPQVLSLKDAASKYFYNLGNAGTFVAKTEYVKKTLLKNKQTLSTTCWPQTELMFNAMYLSKRERPFYVSGEEVVSSDNHNDNVFYNSWYIAETFLFSLLRVSQHIENENNDKDFYHHAKKAIPGVASKIKYWYRFLLYYTMYDYNYEREKTKQLLKENKQYLLPAKRKYVTAYAFITKIPQFIRIGLCNGCFIFFNLKNPFKGLNNQWKEVKLNKALKLEIYTKKGKLTEDTDRYIY
jgi:glycosyltransferase involved in cell wall biosynthesis